jgi:adenylate cyclase
VRIGIDTGPVVAGVIGRAKFIYDLWGDTVNTASRMETHALPGTIQVTSRAYDRLRPRYQLRPRGPIEVKGKGPMNAYLLIGPRDQSHGCDGPGRAMATTIA